MGLFVATMAGAVVGFLVCEVNDDLLEVEPAEVAVRDMVVTAASRRAGVGRALLAAAHAFAAERKIGRLVVSVLLNNAEARQAYAALGFRDVVMWMEKPVSAA